jgi:hypothetical protein
MKNCPGCRTRKPYADFSRDRSKADGRQARCRACHKEIRKKRRERDEVRARAWRAANRDKAREACKRYHEKHRIKRLAVMKAWQRRGGNASKAVARWRAKNPEAAKVINQRRRGLERGAEGTFSRAEWEEKLELYGRCCAYCRRPRKMTIHHVVPLAKGGTNYASNIVPACGSCNSSIGTKTVLPKEACHL